MCLLSHHGSGPWGARSVQLCSLMFGTVLREGGSKPALVVGCGKELGG